MANVLKNIFTPSVDQIAQNYIIESWHVSQSVDAFTGIVAYNINLSGSFAMTGSIKGNDFTSSLFGVGFYGTSSWAANSSQSTSASYALTASYALSSAGGASAGGADEQIQFNSGSTLSGSSNFRYNYNLHSLEMGDNVVASGTGSFAQGRNASASGLYSHAEGFSTLANGYFSHAEGYSTISSGSYSHAEGYSTTSSGGYSHAEGSNTVSPGAYSHAEGYSTLSSGLYSHAEGSNTTANGDVSHAEGSQTTASGTYAHAEGYGTIASGSYSHAEGFQSISLGWGSHAEGADTISSGLGSFAIGQGTVASGSYQTVIGNFNVSYNSADTIFIVGNGTGNSMRSNAFRVSGSGNCYAGGAFINGGADYAEYFESLNGTRLPYGVVVELTGSKIQICTNPDNAIGVISSKPTLVGNSDGGTGDEWVGKYQKDIWGNYIYEDYTYQEIAGIPSGSKEVEYIDKIGTRRSLNPSYDATKIYIPREQRPEWNIVGLLGQIKILKDQHIPPRWIKMKDIDDNIGLYLVR